MIISSSEICPGFDVVASPAADSPAADDPARRRIMAQPIDVVHVLVAREPSKDRLPEQSSQGVPTFLPLRASAKTMPAIAESPSVWHNQGIGGRLQVWCLIPCAEVSRQSGRGAILAVMIGSLAPNGQMCFARRTALYGHRIGLGPCCSEIYVNLPFHTDFFKTKSIGVPCGPGCRERSRKRVSALRASIPDARKRKGGRPYDHTAPSP
jgi:hypothetical protein